MNQPILTIAVPTYNGEKTIRIMLDLLLPQCDEKIEILISNNCSTDSTKDIIDEYLKQYKSIRVINNNKNIGPDANFLQCMQLAKGKYTWLVSDDDIIFNGAVKKVTDFLVEHENVGLVYVNTLDFRGKFESVQKCTPHKPQPHKNYYTNDKQLFMKYAGYYWGFMSSYICNTEKFKRITEPERFFGTYWLQSYIHALCASGETYLGVIKDPCVGAGIYVNTTNYDPALVNGSYYKELIDYMITNCEFDKKQLYKMYSRRLCHLSRHDLVKEKALGKNKTNLNLLIRETKTMPEAWLTVYPLFLIPSFVCRFAMRIYKTIRGMEAEVGTNRQD